MAKTTIYYFTYIDKTGVVRPRRLGTLDAIEKTGLEAAKPLLKTALEVDESELDEEGFYPKGLRHSTRG